MRVFVVNAYPDRKEKYLKDKRYELFQAVHWTDVDHRDHDYGFYHNACDDHRNKVIACSLSHQKLLLQIIQDGLEDVIIIEDDALLDFDRLDELKDINEFCYIGGLVVSIVLKDNLNFIKDGTKDIYRGCFEEGLNQIQFDNFKIGQTCGYYIPNPKVAEMILDNIPARNKQKAIDVEYHFLQKKGLINKFIYPALVTLHIPDAKKGFTYSSYKLYDNQLHY
jgi:GR25 family glycosyltransferase involved in LPS biosynthesis